MNWTRKAAKAITLSLTTGFIVGAGAFTADAAPTAGVSNIISSASSVKVQSVKDAAKKIEKQKDTISASTHTTRSGVSLVLSGIVSNTNKSVKSTSSVVTGTPADTTAAEEEALLTDTTDVKVLFDIDTDNYDAEEAKKASDENGKTIDKETKEEKEAEELDITNINFSDFSRVGIANVTSYVYIRSNPDTESDYTGKLYPKQEATVLSEEGDWYKVKSGDVKGYIRKDLLTVGDQATIEACSRKVAIVDTTTLYVRKDMSTDAKVLTMVPITDDLTVTDASIRDKGWVKVDTEAGEGFVSTEFVKLSVEYKYAESKEAEAARLLAEEQEREAARRAAAASSKKSTKKSSGSKSYAPASGSSGSSVVAFASQFVGNPYVYGGSSLTNGTDCSGFVMSVYANFGVTLPHSSRSMRSVGYGVSASEMQPGDIVCYSGHVGIYAGNGTIVNASTPSTGIKYTNVNYRKILAVRRIF